MEKDFEELKRRVTALEDNVKGEEYLHRITRAEFAEQNEGVQAIRKKLGELAERECERATGEYKPALWCISRLHGRIATESGAYLMVHKHDLQTIMSHIISLQYAIAEAADAMDEILEPSCGDAQKSGLGENEMKTKTAILEEKIKRLEIELAHEKEWVDKWQANAMRALCTIGELRIRLVNCLDAQKAVTTQTDENTEPEEVKPVEKTGLVFDEVDLIAFCKELDVSEIEGYFYNVFSDVMGIDGDISYADIIQLADLIKKHMKHVKSSGS